MRSYLFVPGDSTKKLEKSLTSGSDSLIVDLEDSVGFDNKPKARDIGLGFLREIGPQKDRPQLVVRVNALDTGLTDDDLAVIVAGKPDAILLPKAEGGASVTHLDAKLTVQEALHGLPEGSIEILALTTETASALFLCGTYKGSSKRLTGLTWGAEDLSASLGSETNRDKDGNLTEPFRFARTLSLAAAAACGVAPIDTVYADFRNEAGLRRECEEARRDGFTSKMAIHPGQVAVINDVFTPSEKSIAEAQGVVDAFAAQPGAGVVAMGGVMFDRPHLVRAERLLARAKTVRR
ncbi:(3S)-malyl-CoA thioesterase [Variibacter gotjawalensis]|uniref:(3S)-malyl-CoA thioesterase n=1 Tax=Variibacter gotjawalensis TaxID=1333996 RepID=A0A0S3PWB4_9BRAD|nr:CoA ester lyase [Variibacter gotjawalensis]NIK46021.1 citrate lyase subunit beta/citryl-CoA lyase [Variibacter gotjawalensis]RZS47939.1 citrate lyase subunit beta/citryl-CoA lyase [Variibacter gotjawalensis]BAT60195.1 (3S)-malyl-CoA thioesterase [Variibacter gotjawalensis]